MGIMGTVIIGVGGPDSGSNINGSNINGGGLMLGAGGIAITMMTGISSEGDARLRSQAAGDHYFSEPIFQNWLNQFFWSASESPGEPGDFLGQLWAEPFERESSNILFWNIRTPRSGLPVCLRLWSPKFGARKLGGGFVTLGGSRKAVRLGSWLVHHSGAIAGVGESFGWKASLLTVKSLLLHRSKSPHTVILRFRLRPDQLSRLM
jgi:hypothetical protein